MAGKTQESGHVTLARRVGDNLRRRGWTLATAESCTGGMIGAAITSMPGSSDCYLGGIVAYSNEIKTAALGVKEATLAKHGAVSAQTAREMAQGVRRGLRANVGLSVTGIAGPGGGTREKPIGLVFIGLATARGTATKRFVFRGGRAAVRKSAVQQSLLMLVSVSAPKKKK